MKTGKIFVALLLGACLFLSGGCGSGKSNNFAPTSENINTIWAGAWTGRNGTAKVSGDLGILDFGITNIAMLVSEPDVDDDTGSAIITVLMTLNNGEILTPLFYNKLKVSTEREDVDTWTMKTPHGTFTINFDAETSANFSGKINYLESEVEFSAAIAKNNLPGSGLTPSEVLNGTWKFNSKMSGGYMISGTQMFEVVPEYILMCFEDTTNTATTTTTSGRISMPPALFGESSYENSLIFIDTEEESEISHIHGDIYELVNTDTQEGLESMIYIFSETKISLLMNLLLEGGQVCTLIQLEKLSEDEEIDINEAFSSEWHLTEGGGLAIPVNDDTVRYSLNAESFDISFSEVSITNGEGTAKVSANGEFLLGSGKITQDFEDVPATIKTLGINLLQITTEQGSKFYISLTSEKEAIIIADLVYPQLSMCLITAELKRD